EVEEFVVRRGTLAQRVDVDRLQVGRVRQQEAELLPTQHGTGPRDQRGQAQRRHPAYGTATACCYCCCCWSGTARVDLEVAQPRQARRLVGPPQPGVHAAFVAVGELDHQRVQRVQRGRHLRQELEGVAVGCAHGQRLQRR